MLTAEQLETLEETFRELDTEGKGTLTIVQLQMLWATMFPQMSEREVADETQRAWRDIDVDGDNAITLKELLQFLDPSDDDIGELLGVRARYQRPRNLREYVWAIVDQAAAQEYDVDWIHHASLAFNVITQVAILISIGTMVVESLPEMQSEDGLKSGNSTTRGIEAACIAVFTLELVVRILTAPKLKKVLTSGWTAIDVLAILPFYLEEAGGLGSESAAGSLVVLRVLRLARLVRVLRVLKLGRNSEGIQIMMVALQRSRMALTWLVLLLMMAMLLFASLMFHVEKEDSVFIKFRYEGATADQSLWVRKNSSTLPDAGTPIFFQSIPVAMWWALVTLTTVGYGDSYPVTDFGRVVGSVTMISGLLVMAFPTTMLCNNFSEVCAEFMKKKELKARRAVMENRVRELQLAHAADKLDAKLGSGDLTEAFACLNPDMSTAGSVPFGDARGSRGTNGQETDSRKPSRAASAALENGASEVPQEAPDEHAGLDVPPEPDPPCVPASPQCAPTRSKASASASASPRPEHSDQSVHSTSRSSNPSEGAPLQKQRVSSFTRGEDGIEERNWPSAAAALPPRPPAPPPVSAEIAPSQLLLSMGRQTSVASQMDHSQGGDVRLAVDQLCPDIAQAVTAAMQAATKRADRKTARLSERVQELERVVKEQLPSLREEIAELRHLLKAQWSRGPAGGNTAAARFGFR
eukprot:TRINITY_DN2723_c0_g4_i1.p1 TRINITY_DN2723_c0_g4~~TRINITY_DN2723_c0_g4_i1.p1  ORF type:complete len:695 (+),score=159.73 TRINITY_DN2723_c0_g4_i1:100-2184(+)